MTAVDRRGWLCGAAASLLAPAAARADGTRMYDYLFLDLETPPGAPPSRGLAEHLRAEAGSIAASGGQVLGLFTPQLGWHARQAVVLIGWSGAAKGREAVVTAVADAPGVARVERHRLAPTARPGAGDRPKPGGIYVHRWFTIDTAALDEFVALSTEGWRDFEARFDTNIFGLFTAAPSDADRKAGVVRLLLLTRYGDHGVWETSRDPSTAAMAAFMRRQKLTRDTWAASSLLTAL